MGDSQTNQGRMYSALSELRPFGIKFFLQNLMKCNIWVRRNL